MFFSFELNTLDHYDYKNHEYSTIESDIFHVLKVLSEKFTLYEYWIYKSKKRLENVEMDIPVASKKLVKKICILIKLMILPIIKIVLLPLTN